MAVVLITGCRSGIGLQTALAFARRGDRVYATSRDVGRADQLRQSVDRESLPVEIRALNNAAQQAHPAGAQGAPQLIRDVGRNRAPVS
jgi:NAD(P)-dependent dehydrogenase (short-subunit alcohol dehydrogenase family)